MSRARREQKSGKDEVDELLEAAEALMLLRLNTDSHIARGADSLAPDLTSRFNALKAPAGRAAKQPPPRSAPKKEEAKILPATVADEEMRRILGDDLSSRFATLKGSSSSSVSSLGNSSGWPLNQKGDGVREGGSDDSDVDEDGVSKKEVEKMMQWAFDAARLDPSPSDDDDDGALDLDEINGDTSTTSDDGDGDDAVRRNRGNVLEKKKKKKHLF